MYIEYDVVMYLLPPSLTCPQIKVVKHGLIEKYIKIETQQKAFIFFFFHRPFLHKEPSTIFGGAIHSKNIAMMMTPSIGQICYTRL